MTPVDGTEVVDLNCNTNATENHCSGNYAHELAYARTAVDTTDNVIYLDNHGLAEDQSIVYSTNSSGNVGAIGGLSNGQTYFVKKLDDDRIQLTTSAGGDVVSLTSTGDGSAHQFRTQRNSGIGAISVVASVAVGVSDGFTLAGSAAASFNTIDKDIESKISGGAVVTGDQVNVQTNTSDEIRGLSVAAAVSNRHSFAGQFTRNWIDSDAVASIDGSTVTATGSGGDITLASENRSTIDSLTGSAVVAAGKESGVGVGASLSINVIADTTDALIQDSTVTASGGDVQVTSMSAAEINSIAASLVAASGTAVSGSFTINVLNNRTRSLISGANTSVTADGNVWLDANDRGNVVAVSGGVALGGFLKNKETDEESAGGAIPTIGLSNSTVVTSNLVEASLSLIHI